MTKYSIGWPPGYEDGSPHASEPTRKAAKNPTVTPRMRSGGLDAVPQWRGYLGPLTRSELEEAKTARIRSGSL